MRKEASELVADGDVQYYETAANLGDTGMPPALRDAAYLWPKLTTILL